MRYAKLIKLGGEYIAAEDADYDDYKGFLTCPECGEPVFLRKAHQRKNAHIADAFVHHKAVPSIELCELRVSRYSTEYIRGKNAESRGQRLAVLQSDLFLILQHSVFAQEVTQHEYEYTLKGLKRGAKRNPLFSQLIKNLVSSLLKEKSFLNLLERLKSTEEKTMMIEYYSLFLKDLEGIIMVKDMSGETKIHDVRKKYGDIGKIRAKEEKKLENLGIKIMGEALDIFLCSQMNQTRSEILYLVLHPVFLERAKNTKWFKNNSNLQMVNDFLNPINYEKWIHSKNNFAVIYIMEAIILLFTTVPWVEILKSFMEPNHVKKCLAHQSAGRGFGKAS